MLTWPCACCFTLQKVLFNKKRQILKKYLFLLETVYPLLKNNSNLPPVISSLLGDNSDIFTLEDLSRFLSQIRSLPPHPRSRFLRRLNSLTMESTKVAEIKLLGIALNNVSFFFNTLELNYLFEFFKFKTFFLISTNCPIPLSSSGPFTFFWLIISRCITLSTCH